LPGVPYGSSADYTFKIPLPSDLDGPFADSLPINPLSNTLEGPFGEYSCENPLARARVSGFEDSRQFPLQFGDPAILSAYYWLNNPQFTSNCRPAAEFRILMQ